MISVAEAEALILEDVPLGPAVALPIDSITGEVLRESIRADRPFPPFDRVAMDGIAISLEGWRSGTKEFPVAGIQRAGEARKSLADVGTCFEVMTGAMLPEGCDCVIPVEMITLENDLARLSEDCNTDSMKNVHQFGSDRKEGDVLLDSGTLLFGPQCAVAATVGAAMVTVSKRPRIAIVSTGDELVPVDATPEPFQIRRSNSHAVKSLLAGAGFHDTELCHLHDDLETIETGLGKLLKTASTVIVSGGVSAGRYDYVPAALAKLGVQQVFHKVSQRPGKPLWFGIGPEGQRVYGLPGNPVSGVVCCHRYVLPALWKALGAGLCPLDQRPRAVLSEPLKFKPPLTLFKPVSVGGDASGARTATPVKMGGSGDLAGLSDSDGFIELAAEKEVFDAGTRHPLWLWSDPTMQVQTRR
jgi:molybdopterin molybdotransferase